jgi:hypothetical protein
MTSFRKVVMGAADDDGNEFEDILVLPDHTTTAQLMLDPDNADIVCTCVSHEGADLIVQLLNEHYAKKEAH